MPLGFINDKDNKKYINTYFNTYANIWWHGILLRALKIMVLLFMEDPTQLNPGGIRIWNS